MSGTLLTPPGLLGSTQPATQPGAGLGQLYNAVNGQMQGGGIWGNQGMTPPPAPLPTYDQWGQMQGGTPNLNTGPGLPQQAGAPTQQVAGTFAPTQGIGGTRSDGGVGGGNLSGLYDQWGRPTPLSVALSAAQSQQAPQQQQGFDASGIDQKTLGALQYSAPGLAALSALSGVPNPYAGVPQGGGGRGLLGNAVEGEGSGGGYGGNVTGGSTGALGAGGPPGGSGNAAVDAAAAASASAAAEQEQALGGMY